jgi:hypothetical protein
MTQIDGLTIAGAQYWYDIVTADKAAAVVDWSLYAAGQQL